jgi:hypothetical protein
MYCLCFNALRLVSSLVDGIIGAVLSEKPNTALAKLGRIGGG